MPMIESQPIKWHGGKSYLAAWIHSLAPSSCIADPASGYTHRNIVFAGGLGEFWNWQPVEGISEAVNDANGALTNFYRVLSDSLESECLIRELAMQPLSQDAFDELAGVSLDPGSEQSIGRAKAFFIRYRRSGECSS